MNKDLGRDSIPKLLFELSLPAIASMLVAAIYNMVDRAFVGRVSPLGLTAIGITMPIQVLQMAFLLLIGVGSATLISIKYGENDIESAENLLANSLLLIIITETILTIVCLIFIDPIFSLLGVSQSVNQLAKDYILIILIGGVPGLTGYCLNNTVRSIGRSKTSMNIVVISSLLNIVLDYIFVIILNYGVKGAAIATVISQTYVTIEVLRFFLKNNSVPIRLHLNKVKLKSNSIKEIFLNGLPNFYMQIFGTIVSIVLNRFIIELGGDYHLASVTIITSITLFFTMIIYGISQGAQPIIGYNFGAKKFERSIETLKLTSIFIFIISLIFLIFMEVFPQLFISIFTQEKNLLKLTSNIIKIYLLGLPFIALHSIATTFLQATKQPKQSSILYILRYGGLLIPLLFILPRFLGVMGVYWSNALSDIISGLVAFIYITINIKSLKQIDDF
ncbi:MATE family efflux transporter [Peptostreptococcus equinus]|uniref:Multidrug export protein MepA n=1 Tax=Peptostreptococcus equinus TaxID=3003601 RepID=A0ABY7JRG5_9FIRM|nr:MATE family efflux transporter [Peptostreptococcus sp. CBA3647]WAW15739.1 MATE family efflux transporter [Peptostreptococcus sp. CBA3647]